MPPKQDMPPKGGYGPIDWVKKAPKKPVNGILFMTGIFAFSAANYYLYTLSRDRKKKLKYENFESRIALEPFLISERNRQFLLYLHKNREEETKLMKDVPEWEVGKWYDYPVYHNPRGLWTQPITDEFYAHLTHCQAISKKTIHHNYV